MILRHATCGCKWCLGWVEGRCNRSNGCRMWFSAVVRGGPYTVLWKCRNCHALLWCMCARYSSAHLHSQDFRLAIGLCDFRASVKIMRRAACAWGRLAYAHQASAMERLARNIWHSWVGVDWVGALNRCHAHQANSALYAASRLWRMAMTFSAESEQSVVIDSVLIDTKTQQAQAPCLLPTTCSFNFTLYRPTYARPHFGGCRFADLPN